ncbi:hypothetical protein LXA43DRAFT_922446 [Ganoderma leucocontextum]|nr:hypothetical protein LXA43DRAFT_922446 [Ganoderma leucocontextum]
MATFPHEILSDVCECLMVPDTDGPPEAQYLGFQTIPSLARTCRDFHDHALNALWHTIPSVALLVYTLPQDAWEAEVWEGKWKGDDAPKTHVQMVLRRPLVDDDLLRWKYYAPRVVRVLPVINCEWFPERARFHETDPSIMDALASLFPHGSLLPNLRVYHTFHVDGFGLYRTLPVLFGPKLRNFYHCCVNTPSAFDSEENDYTRMLAKLRERSPSLESLGFSAEPCSSRFADNVLHDLSHYRVLVLALLDGIPVTAPALLHLSTVKNLQSLHATLSPELSEDAFDDVPPAAHFPTLRHTYLQHETSLAVCTAVIRFIRSKVFSTAEVKCDSPGSATVAHVRDFFSALADSPFQSSPMRISLEVNALANPESSPITNDTFAGLLRLKVLVALDLNICHPFAIDDELIAALAHSFPDLTYLNLATKRPWKGPPPRSASAPGGAKTSETAPSIRTLVQLAKHCPHMHTVGFALDARTCDPETRPGGGTVHTKLRTLRVGCSTIASPEAVAAFLSDVFPKLFDVDNDWAREVDLEGEDAVNLADMDAEERRRLEREVRNREAWWDVEYLIKEFMGIRMQERDWAGRRARSVSVTSSSAMSE